MRTNGGTQSPDIAAGYLLNLLYLFTVICYYCQKKQGVCSSFSEQLLQLFYLQSPPTFIVNKRRKEQCFSIL